MSKITSEKLVPSQDIVSQILISYGIIDFTLTPIKQGISNTALKISTPDHSYVMRIYAHQRKTDEQILFELRFQDYLRINEIPIPVVYKNHDGCELSICQLQDRRWQIILMDFIDGSSMITEHTDTLIQELATIQSRMHTLGSSYSHSIPQHKSWDVLIDYYALHLTDVTRFSSEVKDFLARAKDFKVALAADLPKSYNHLDFDLDGNVIVSNGHIRGVVDFDDLSLSPSVVCLGYSLWNVLHDADLDAVKKYLYYYKNIRPLNHVELISLSNIVLFRNYQIGALRLFKTGDEARLVRPLQIERMLLRNKIAL